MPQHKHHRFATNFSTSLQRKFAYDVTVTTFIMKQYQYSPLPKGRDEFRLLNLLPGPKSADIELEIFHVTRSSQPEYEALSYAWGHLKRTDIALVRERESLGFLSHLVINQELHQRNEGSNPITTMGITHNLAIALRHLRHSSEPRILWIDALCINQDNLPERSEEVLEMGSIYSNARQVIVWLGPSSSDSQLAIETLTRLGKETIFTVEDRIIECKQGSWAGLLLDDANALKSNAPSWIAIRDLLRREWFSRLWVFQEIGLSTSATVFVGEDLIDWQLFVTSLQWLWPRLGQLNQLIEDLAFEDFAISSISGFLDLTERKSQDLALLWLLGRATKLFCFDPRDRIYAIRGLARPEDREFIVPDYSKSVGEVFKDFTLQLIQGTGVGYILTRCFLPNTPWRLQIPSWVPDLSLANLPEPLPVFKASGMSKIAAVSNSNSLAVQAVKIATITNLMPFMTSSDTDIETIGLCRSWAQLCSSGAYVGGRSTLDAVLETILCGRIADLFPRGLENCLNLEECRRVLEGFGAVRADPAFELDVRKFVRGVRIYLRGRAFFKSHEGFLGACPKSANDGDQVAVILGCHSPLVLRPVTLQGEPYYRIIGVCYVPGIMNTEALLGLLPPGWSVKYESIDGNLFPVFARENTKTQQDPRAPLPPPWRYVYLDGENFESIESDEDKGMREQYFENLETGETTWFDPRLSPEALRERGVDIQELVLV
jgi:hypothetical protein